MAMQLDPQAEERIEQVIQRGPRREPVEVIAHAEPARRPGRVAHARETIDAPTGQSLADLERNAVYSAEEAARLWINGLPKEPPDGRNDRLSAK